MLSKRDDKPALLFLLQPKCTEGGEPLGEVSRRAEHSQIKHSAVRTGH